MTTQGIKNRTPKLQVLISTYSPQGLERVGLMSLPKLSDVGYLVACQSAECEVPNSLQRDDVEVYFSSSIGLSRNRNFALSKSTSPYVLIADDDLIFSSERLKDVISVFDAHPRIDIATFRCRFPFHKVYPPEETSLPTDTRGYYVTSYEIALRTASIRRVGLSFNEHMGVGAQRFLCGEEAVFIHNALALGLSCRFFPITVVEHPDIPTGRRRCPSPGVLQADGVIIALNYKFTLLPRLVLKAWRVGGNVFSNFFHLLKGAMFQLRHPNFFTANNKR